MRFGGVFSGLTGLMPGFEIPNHIIKVATVIPNIAAIPARLTPAAINPNILIITPGGGFGVFQGSMLGFMGVTFPGLGGNPGGRVPGGSFGCPGPAGGKGFGLKTGLPFGLLGVGGSKPYGFLGYGHQPSGPGGRGTKSLFSPGSLSL